MPNQYSAEKKTIGELLSLTSPSIEVPEWQRNYSWDTSHVETFWHDLVSFSDLYPDNNITEQEYFLGSIVLVNSGTTHLLLDGQQRLATATIALSALRDTLSEYRENAATRLAQKYITDYDDATGQNAYKLTLNRYDRTFFRAEIQDTRDPDVPASAPTLQSHVLIRQARQFFAQRFREQAEALGGGRAAFDWGLRVQRVLTGHVSVVAVSSLDEDNAASVFETLNDRGIGLSTPDLLRNLVLRRAENDDDRERIIEYWRTILAIEDAARVDEFLRHYWLSHHGDVKTRSLYREMKAWIQDNDVNSLSFSQDLAETALVYRDLVAAHDDDADLRRGLEAIAMLGAKSLMPVLLSGYTVGNDDQKRTLVTALIALFIRHNVIGNRETTVLEATIYGAAKQLRDDEDFTAAVASFAQLAPSDEDFVNQFKRRVVSRRATARYLLREIEHAKRATQEVQVETPDRVHVEHIYPQTPQEGHRAENHGAIINRLGNQTLLARRLNTSVRNSPFDVKRPIYAESDLLMTKELAEYESWDAAAIDRRQEQLTAHVAEIWLIPPP